MNEIYKVPLTIITSHHRRTSVFFNLKNVKDNYQSSLKNTIGIPSLIHAFN